MQSHFATLRRTIGDVIRTNSPRLAIALRGLRSEQKLHLDQARAHYFNLIAALDGLGERERAAECTALAIRHGVWRNKLQLPKHFLYSIPDRHIYDKRAFDCVARLEENFALIRAEVDIVTDPHRHGFTPVKEHDLVRRGAWDELIFYEGGQRFEAACRLFPQTAKLLESLPDVTGPGAVSLSWLHPGTRVRPHCGPTNSVLRVHLGLKIPDGCGMRIKDERLVWQEGKCLVFDHSFEHEVWNDAETSRVILLFDMFHPQLTEQQKRSLPPEYLTLSDVAEKLMRERGIQSISRQRDGTFSMRPDRETAEVLAQYFDRLGLDKISLDAARLKLETAAE